MGRSYGKTSTSDTVDNLIVKPGSLDPIPISLNSARTAALSRGEVLGRKTVGGTYHTLAPAASDGTQTPVVIAAEAMTATEVAASKQTSAYPDGGFNGASLVWGATVNSTQKRDAIISLQARNIEVYDVDRQTTTTTTTSTTTT